MGQVSMDNAALVVTFALAAAPAYLALGALMGADTLAVPVRVGLWVIAAIAVWLVGDVSADHAATLSTLGLAMPTQRTAMAIGAGLVALVACGSLVALLQYMLGLPFGDREGFNRIAVRSWPLRLLVVLTAAVVEEVLYRGVGIGFGSHVLGGATVAAAISTLVFTAAHFRWSPAHLLQVFVAGSVLSGLYVVTGDLMACIAVHLIADLPILVAPMFMRPGTAGAPRA
jgi:membrane protease YdiL (CAAX protease family)